MVGGGNRGPKGAVVREDTEVVGDVAEQVIDKDEEQKWSEDAPLRHTSMNGEVVRGCSSDNHPLAPVRKKACEPRQ
jgi:hypothetical protein